MTNRFHLECSGFLEKDPEGASLTYRKELCDQLVMSAEVEVRGLGAACEPSVAIVNNQNCILGPIMKKQESSHNWVVSEGLSQK